MSTTVLFPTIQFCISMQFNSIRLTDKTCQVLTLRVRVDLGAMAVKEYSTFPKAPALLEPHHQIVLNYIQDTLWGSVTPLHRSSRGILQPQLTGQGPLWHAMSVSIKFTFMSQKEIFNRLLYLKPFNCVRTKD